MAWQNRFDRLLKAMSQGEPHKSKAAPQMQPIRKHLGPTPEV